ncbi:MAG: hypothetical protein CMM77_11445 [Rhodospirillaceae bacterium]|nr:hypothetical protein [Magnetovibrio sp.]MAY67730.1 hypothetical protein [Rhodospirillaceae bacterium]
MTNVDRKSAWLRDATAIALGLTIPAMVSGRAVLQGLAAVSLVAILIIAWQDQGIRRRAETAFRSRLGVAIFAAFAAMAISIPGSLEPLRSFDAWARTLVYIGGCVLFWAFLAEDTRARRLCHQALVVGALAGGILVIVAVAGFQLPLQFVKNEFGRLPSNWATQTPKAYASAMSCLIPVLIWLAWRYRAKWRALAGAAAVFGIAVIIGADNKSALAGLLAMVLAVCLAMALRNMSANGGRRGWAGARSWIAVALAAVVGILALVNFLPDPPPSTPVWTWIPSWLIDTHRQQIWHFTMSRIADAPWLGYGMNTIDRVAGADTILPGYKVQVLPSHPHNWILEVLAETGLIGFLPVILCLAWFIARHFLRHHATASRRALAHLSLAAVFWSSSLFNFSIWSSWWLITFFLLAAIIAAAPDDPAP